MKKYYERIYKNINKLIEEHPHIVIEDEHCDPIKGCLRTLQSSIRTISQKL